MSINEFRLLTQEQQCKVLHSEGKYLAGMEDKNLTLNLYSIFNFYAEVAYDLVNNYLASIKIIQDSNMLLPYLEEVVLPFYGRESDENKKYF